MNFLNNIWMKGQSKIAYLPKFPKMMTNLMMIMTWMLMIKTILKFKIYIMMLPIIKTHLRKYTLLYHVPWYHCSKQELWRNRTVTSLMTLLFFIQFKLWSNFWKSLMATKAGFKRVQPKLGYISWQQSHLHTIHSIFVSSRYYQKWQNYSHSNIRAIWWNYDLVFRPMILKSLVSCKNNFWSRRDIKIYSYRQRCAIPRATFWAVDGRSS